VTVEQVRAGTGAVLTVPEEIATVDPPA
jgi:hypothetical protein